MINSFREYRLRLRLLKCIRRVSSSRVIAHVQLDDSLKVSYITYNYKFRLIKRLQNPSRSRLVSGFLKLPISLINYLFIVFLAIIIRCGKLVQISCKGKQVFCAYRYFADYVLNNPASHFTSLKSEHNY